MKIAVVGTGAMGSIYAGLLADAGNEVWAIDVWDEHIAAIRAHGLHVEGASGDRIVRTNLHASTVIADAGSCDLFIVATKAHDVGAAARSIRPLLGANTPVLAMQNGLGAAERISQHVPAANVLIGIGGGFGASLRGPAHVHHNGMAMINVGEMHGGMSERLEQVVAVWSAAGFNARAFENIDQLVWEKLICNCAFSAPCTVLNRTVGEMLDDPSARQISLTCGIEAWQTGRAAGVPISFDDPERHLLNFASNVLDARPSMLQDHLAGRRSEIDFINGAIPEVAARVGARAPYNEVVTAIVRAREADFV